MDEGRVRLVEVLGTLSLACDAADGFAHETTIRTAVLAGHLARHAGRHDVVADVVIGALLRHIGCTAFAAEEAHRYGAGDDVGLRSVMAEVDPARPDRAAVLVADRLAAHAPPAERAAALGRLLGDGALAVAEHDAAQCDAAEHLTSLLPVSTAAARAASDAFERWDGGGGPRRLAGEAISGVARVVEVAYVAELFRSRQGRGGATAELRARSGGQLEPDLVAAFLDGATALFDDLDDPRRSVWERLCDAEPGPPALITRAQVDATALAFARFTDLKSAWFTGHSEAVAALAGASAAAAGLDPEVSRLVRRAGLLHDVGRVGVPTGIWDLPRPLSRPEADRVRFHAWETERILTATPLFGPVAAVAAAAHERPDGSGYPHGRLPDHLALSVALLATADMWCALTSNRPHRAALDPRAARDVIAVEAADHRLHHDAVAAVLETVGQPAPPPPARPAGLTDREADVLRGLATGAGDKQIAAELGITAKTVAHHVQHIYDKIGVRSRAGATLYALEHRLHQ